MKRFSIFFVVSLLAIPPALAGPAHPKGVVELFTSQSCSSCPPADAVLARLAARDDVIALSYHVDYWNYLGWRDTFSARKFTDRQYGYAKTFGRGSVYTPQMVIDGRDAAIGSDEAVVEEKLKALADGGKGPAVPITASQSAGKITIKVGAGGGNADLLLVYFDKKATVAIGKGENSGKTITYWHVVRDVQTVGMWDGKTMSVVMPASVIKGSSSGGCAILLQEMSAGNAPGAILGATVVSATGG